MYDKERASDESPGSARRGAERPRLVAQRAAQTVPASLSSPRPPSRLCAARAHIPRLVKLRNPVPEGGGVD
eukprot:scaffold94102_cov31-Tisochrysis_lutea.AAC.1